MTTVLEQLENVTLKLKANIYFEGGVTSHTVTSRDGVRRTIGLIRIGHYHFTTDAPEQMDILSGSCRIKFPNDTSWKTVNAGETFHVPGKSTFDIAVDSGLTEYLCTFK